MLQNQVRVIAGIWRGRKINFPDVVDLRPTSDRIRETLFNWLAPYILKARCLDLFAGSGILGIEALSRGAQHVDFVDESSCVVRAIEHELKKLEAKQWVVKQLNSLRLLSKPPIKPYDIVFLDPPFKKDLLTPCCKLLIENQWLSHNALIYLEYATQTDFDLPSELEFIKQKLSGSVNFSLARLKE